MLDAPEAAGGDGAFLRGIGDVLSATFSGTEAHLGGGGEWPEEARDEVGHQAGHDYGEDGEDEDLWRELQVGVSAGVSN